jgi:16S rRNA processing protein RimM
MRPSEPEFVIIGYVLAPWGNKGKLKVKTATDFPQRFTPSATVYVNRQLTTIDGTEWHKGNAIIKLSTIDSLDSAEKLKGQPLEIHHSQLKSLPEGQYYQFQLIGLEVWTTSGELLGTIADILTAESNDNYIVRGARGEVLIPAIEDVVKSIDLKEGCITIEPVEGLLTLNMKPST